MNVIDIMIKRWAKDVKTIKSKNGYRFVYRMCDGFQLGAGDWYLEIDKEGYSGCIDKNLILGNGDIITISDSNQLIFSSNLPTSNKAYIGIVKDISRNGNGQCMRIDVNEYWKEKWRGLRVVEEVFKQKNKQRDFERWM